MNGVLLCLFLLYSAAADKALPKRKDMCVNSFLSRCKSMVKILEVLPAQSELQDDYAGRPVSTLRCDPLLFVSPNGQ